MRHRSGCLVRSGTSDPTLGSVIASAELCCPDSLGQASAPYLRARAARAIGGERWWAQQAEEPPPAPCARPFSDATLV